MHSWPPINLIIVVCKYSIDSMIWNGDCHGIVVSHIQLPVTCAGAHHIISTLKGVSITVPLILGCWLSWNGLLTDTTAYYMCSCPTHHLSIKAGKFFCCIDSMLWNGDCHGMVFSQMPPPVTCARAHHIILTLKDVSITVAWIWLIDIATMWSFGMVFSQIQLPITCACGHQSILSLKGVSIAVALIRCFEMSIVLHGLLTDTSVHHMCSCPPHHLDIEDCKYYCCIDSMLWNGDCHGMVFSQIQLPNMCDRAHHIILTSKSVSCCVYSMIWNGNCLGMLVVLQIQPSITCARAYYIFSTSKDVRITVPLIRRFETLIVLAWSSHRYSHPSHVLMPTTSSWHQSL